MAILEVAVLPYEAIQTHNNLQFSPWNKNTSQIKFLCVCVCERVYVSVCVCELGCLQFVFVLKAEISVTSCYSST